MKVADIVTVRKLASGSRVVLVVQDGADSRAVRGRAPTPALAICAAILKLKETNSES